MIEGVIHHCTEMAVDHQDVDSHGQSEVAFAFCRLLGFPLLPRLKNHRPGSASTAPSLANRTPIPACGMLLTRPIDWELIRRAGP